MDQYYTFADNMFKRLGMERLKKQADQSKTRTDMKTDEMIDPVEQKIRDYNLGHDNMTKVGLY